MASVKVTVRDRIGRGAQVGIRAMVQDQCTNIDGVCVKDVPWSSNYVLVVFGEIRTLSASSPLSTRFLLVGGVSARGLWPHTPSI